MKIKNIHLGIIAAFLLILYLFSFTSVIGKTDKKKSITTALVNKNNLPEISVFELSDNKNTIYITQKNNLWYVTDDSTGQKFLPGDSDIINLFINYLCEERKIYKITDKIPEKNDFGFTNENLFSIKYYLNDGNFYVLNFGKMDFTKSYRYFMSNKKLTVYEIESNFNEFLSTNIQNWAEPFIISKTIANISDTEDIQKITSTYQNNKSVLTQNSDDFVSKTAKLLELRHGGIGDSSNFNRDFSTEDSLIIQIELGNKSSINMCILESTMREKEYDIKIEYKDERMGVSNLFYSKCSLWTYNKIKEIIL